MFIRRIVGLAAILTVCAAFSFAQYRTATINTSGGKLEVADGVVLVKFNDTSGGAAVSSANTAAGGSDDGEVVPGSGWRRIKLNSGVSVDQAIRSYSVSGAVVSVQPDRIHRLFKVPNDPSYTSQYGLNLINAPASWEFETGSSSNVIVAIMDTGVSGTHPDLASKIMTQSRYIRPLTGTIYTDYPTTDCAGHGTHVAGIAAAITDNGVGVSGVSWGSEILSLRVFDKSVDSCETTDDVAIANAITYAVSVATGTGRRMVINMSLGSTPSSLTDDCGTVEKTAMQYALTNGVPVIAAAGNYRQPIDGLGQPVNCPARISGLTAVGAIDANSTVAYFSAVGPQLAVVAPGVGVLSTYAPNTYATLSGTSMASPFVAGFSALILSASPSLTPAQVRTYITSTADDIGPKGTDDYYGAGRIDMFRSLRLVSRGTLSDFAGEKKAIAFPNPFRPATHRVMNFAVPASAQGPNFEITIYTMTGDKVRTLNSLVWDGLNDAGVQVASGVYLFRTKSDSATLTGKFAVIR